MKGIKGEMNIDFTENYDAEDDIYYVTFKSGEPSIVVEVDDCLLLEVGIFTNFPRGFRVLNFSKSKVGAVSIVAKVKKYMMDSKKEIPKIQQRAERNFENAMNKVLAQCA